MIAEGRGGWRIESSSVWDTFCIEISYYRGYKLVQPGRKCPKPVKTQYAVDYKLLKQIAGRNNQ